MDEYDLKLFTNPTIQWDCDERWKVLTFWCWISLYRHSKYLNSSYFTFKKSGKTLLAKLRNLSWSSSNIIEHNNICILIDVYIYNQSYTNIVINRSIFITFIRCFRQRAKPGSDWWDGSMEELDTEEYIKRIRALNRIKDSYEFSTSSTARIHPNLLLWNFLRDEEFSREAETFVRIMETEQSWDKLRNSKILIQNQILNFKSASELLNLMATKNFTISHFLKVFFLIDWQDRKKVSKISSILRSYIFCCQRSMGWPTGLLSFILLFNL